MFRNQEGIPGKRGNRKDKTHRVSSGQSTVEYIVLVTAVIATIIFFVAPGKDGKQGQFQSKIVNVINETSEGFVDRSTMLDSSHNDTVTYNNALVTVTSATGSLFDVKAKPKT